MNEPGFVTFPATEPIMSMRIHGWANRGKCFALAALLCAAVARADSPPDIATRKRGADWPQFLGLHRDGKSPEVGLVTPWPEQGPKIVWQLPLGEGYGAPTISRGRLFVFDRIGDEMRLTCRNAETSALIWSFTYPTDFEDMLGYSNGPRCSPLIDDDRVYIFGSEGMLHCLSVVDGKVLWKIDTTKQFGVVKNFFGVGSTPLIEGDLLITHIGGSPPNSPPDVYTANGKVSGNGSAIVAFNKLTGEVIYRVSDELASYASPVTATIGDRRWGFVFARGGLIGFDPTTGKQDFHYPWRSPLLESVNAATPVVVGDQVFISETYGPGSSLLKVRPGGYDVVWKDDDVGRRRMQLHWNTPIHVDGYLYGSSGRHAGGADIRCVELKTGNVTWSQPRTTRCSLTYIDGHFIAQAEYGQLILFKANPQRFELVSMAAYEDATGTPMLDYPSWSAVAISRGLMYARGKDRLACIEIIPEGQQ